MDQDEGDDIEGSKVLQVTLLIFFTVAIVKVVHSVITNLTSQLRDIPSPPGHFLLGHLLLLIKSDQVELYDYWFKNFSKNGITRITVFGTERVVISKPDDIKKVLVSESKKFFRPPLVVDALPAMKVGVFGAEGKDHAWQRKILHPMFTSVSVKQFGDLFIEKSSLLIKLWKEKINAENKTSCAFVVGNDVKKLMFDIMNMAAFGYDVNTLSDVNDKKTKALGTIIEQCFSWKVLLVNRYLGFLGHHVTTLFGVENLDYANKVVDNLISEMIANKEKTLKSPTKNGCQRKSKPDLLEIMMKLKDEETGSKMSEEVLKSNVITFMVAGYDTSSSCLTWTLYLLALDEDKQEKARKEVFNASPVNSDITVEDVEKMSYIEYVLKESLRLYSVASIIPRKTLEPVTIGSVCIPKGTIVRIPICYIHRSEEFWTEPSEFKPERFDVNENDVKAKTDIGFRYLPFAMGPSGCIGSKFAMLEMKIIIASLLKNFRLSISPNHPKVGVKIALSMKPEPSPEIQVELVSKN